MVKTYWKIKILKIFSSNYGSFFFSSCACHLYLSLIHRNRTHTLRATHSKWTYPYCVESVLAMIVSHFYSIQASFFSCLGISLYASIGATEIAPHKQLPIFPLFVFFHCVWLIGLFACSSLSIVCVQKREIFWCEWTGMCFGSISSYLYRFRVVFASSSSRSVFLSVRLLFCAWCMQCFPFRCATMYSIRFRATWCAHIKDMKCREMNSTPGHLIFVLFISHLGSR